MKQKTLKNRLYLSGMDSAAPDLARKNGLGLEVTRFSWAPMLDDAESVDIVKNQMRGIDRFWLHAPFAELCPCAIDPKVRQVTKERYLQTINMALLLGIECIVIHGGYIPMVYYPEWFVGQSVAFWREFMKSVPQGVTIALENVMDPSPDMLVDIVQQVDNPQLGLCLDVGHAHTIVSTTPPEEWIASMAPWLKHVHLHNNTGDRDLHLPLNEGTIDMASLLDVLLETVATFTIENQTCAPSLDWLYERGYLE